MNQKLQQKIELSLLTIIIILQITDFLEILPGDLDFIKKQGGRTTQKEIRKNFPMSEAKISLIITELEHRGKIEKIKRGRSNIIILKKE